MMKHQLKSPGGSSLVFGAKQQCPVAPRCPGRQDPVRSPVADPRAWRSWPTKVSKCPGYKAMMPARAGRWCGLTVSPDWGPSPLGRSLQPSAGKTPGGWLTSELKLLINKLRLSCTAISPPHNLGTRPPPYSGDLPEAGPGLHTTPLSSPACVPGRGSPSEKALSASFKECL